jgi:hypothetical protein
MHSIEPKDEKEEGLTTMLKILIVESLDLNFSQHFEVKMPYHSENRELDLGYSLHHILHSSTHLSIQNYSSTPNTRYSTSTLASSTSSLRGSTPLNTLSSSGRTSLGSRKSQSESGRLPRRPSIWKTLPKKSSKRRRESGRGRSEKFYKRCQSGDKSLTRTPR